ncbi:MAG: hypothetical protein K4H23_00400 [Mollicutes bacterium PWAP]|nr:hypothetical protein [Mollicutes bacterium PWAP]
MVTKKYKFLILFLMIDMIFFFIVFLLYVFYPKTIPKNFIDCVTIGSVIFSLFAISLSMYLHFFSLENQRQGRFNEKVRDIENSIFNIISKMLNDLFIPNMKFKKNNKVLNHQIKIQLSKNKQKKINIIEKLNNKLLRLEFLSNKNRELEKSLIYILKIIFESLKTLNTKHFSVIEQNCFNPNDESYNSTSVVNLNEFDYKALKILTAYVIRNYFKKFNLNKNNLNKKLIDKIKKENQKSKITLFHLEIPEIKKMLIDYSWDEWNSSIKNKSIILRKNTTLCPDRWEIIIDND